MYTALQDYLNISNMNLNFSFGVMRQEFMLTIFDDEMFEEAEELYVMISVLTEDVNIIIDIPMATIKIINNDCKNL